MTIPFADLFKKIAARFTDTAEETPPAPARPAPVARPKKPNEQRLSKTILPNTTRSLSPTRDPFRAAAGSAASAKTNRPLQLGQRGVVVGAAAAAATVRPPELPLALAQALEPKLERAISLQLADFIDQVPAGYVKPVEIIDASQHVSLKATEIEKGMAECKPSISLPSLYQQVPEIFLRSVPPDDQTRVALPYEKVLEQFNNAQVRPDQERDPAVPQLDTPILTATIEDTKRFGTTLDPLETSPLPPVKVAPATAKSIADAEPEPAQESVRSVAPALGSQPHPVISLYSPDLMSKKTAPAKKIPFQLPPNGTGAPASERVPASSGPPVPTPLPLPPGTGHVPFQAPPPPLPGSQQPDKVSDTGITSKTAAVETEKKGDEPQPSTSVAVQSAPAPDEDEGTISMALKPLLQNLPAFQLNGDVDAVPQDARIKLALSVIEPQLASGRVAVSPQLFQAAIPENYRELFHPDEAATPVVLSLEEVLKNLPARVLKLRDDQEQVFPDKDFETPFSAKAHEDAQRLHAKPTPIVKDREKPATPMLAPKGSGKPATPMPAPKDSEKPAEPSPVQVKASVPAGEKMDAKEVVARATALPGVNACAITFSDGLNLAGILPPELAADGLCALAPPLLERIEKHFRETKLGPLVAMSLHAGDSALSFFPKGGICLAVFHADGALPKETRAELAELAEKLSRTYA